MIEIQHFEDEGWLMCEKVAWERFYAKYNKLLQVIERSRRRVNFKESSNMNSIVILTLCGPKYYM